MARVNNNSSGELVDGLFGCKVDPKYIGGEQWTDTEYWAREVSMAIEHDLMETCLVCGTRYESHLLYCPSCHNVVRGEPVSGRVIDNDPVNHPSHYTRGGIEVIDALEAWGMNLHLGSAIQYIVRSPYKNNPIQDLKKAIWYLERQIKVMESE